MSNKKYPVGIQSFSDIRKGGYFYIDKTDLIYKLVQTGKYYFLSRPRRFGKSLLISTLESYFKGKKELFRGLAMESLEKEWIEYPVLHLDLNAEKFDTRQHLNTILLRHLNAWEDIWGADEREQTLSDRFYGIIRRAAEKTGKQVVILIDEYDKPLLQTIGNEELQDDFRGTLKAFYGVMKSSDRYIRFALLTGVTKFSKVSVFSDLNNLRDVSLSSIFESICGITKDELYSNLSEEIKELADANGMTEEEAKSELKEWYDGYHFNESCVDIYNPFSILSTFAEMKFGTYWFETGTPTFLVESLKKNRYPLENLVGSMATSDILGGTDSADENPLPVLYQSGYLTIKGYYSEFKTFVLGFPNREVEDGFTRFLLPYYASVQKADSPSEIIRLVQEVRAGKVDSFMTRLQSFFADTPYELVRDLELHYQNVMFIVFKLLGFYTQAEYHTSKGRIDLLVKTDKYIYIMEFKLDGTAEQALQQINEKNYSAPFASDSRTIIKIRANFSNESRSLEKWIVE